MEPCLSNEHLQLISSFNAKTNLIQIEADKTRQKPVLPITKPRGKLSTCFDDNEHIDKIHIMEPIFEIFFDNETLDIVPFNEIPDECFARPKKVYGKKNANTTNAPPTDWPSPPSKSSKGSDGVMFC